MPSTERERSYVPDVLARLAGELDAMSKTGARMPNGRPMGVGEWRAWAYSWVLPLHTVLGRLAAPVSPEPGEGATADVYRDATLAAARDVIDTLGRERDALVAENERLRSGGDEQEEAHLAAVVAMHRRELLAFGQYAAIVHPEDLPVGYRPGMKLVEDRGDVAVRLLDRTQHVERLLRDLAEDVLRGPDAEKFRAGSWEDVEQALDAADAQKVADDALRASAVPVGGDGLVANDVEGAALLRRMIDDPGCGWAMECPPDLRDEIDVWAETCAQCGTRGVRTVTCEQRFFCEPCAARLSSTRKEGGDDAR